MFGEISAGLADNGARLYAGVGADAVEFEGHEHVELVSTVAAIALHGVVDGDNPGSHCLIAHVNHKGVSHLDSAGGGPADHEELVG